ncbi:hypothetical protein OGAPHI_006346 [Ogataea philodendri]|uniref:Isocitrate lyase n=2 Tax=Saccharomycotina TaxID=147537 RepID=A0A9P8NYQ3_9ASCO|nr:uncharacterized protein OGAPHI_006346 [Ogataea philodendri]KAH3661499.1 hypothetical protein OGAPHI_006346 [Ogataea philodendri]
MTELISQYENDIARIEAWWASDRQKHLQRPYSSAKVASMRNTIPLEYPSSIQGNKLWKLLNKHREEQTPIMTFGCVDPGTASQMSRAGMELVYVSGGVSGLQIAPEIGRDHADYPSDTVPRVVSHLFKSQCFHDRRQKSYFLGLSKEEQQKFQINDYLLPMVADGDMGFGSVTAIMKETKMFVEAGTAMVHFDDLAIGLKKFTEKVGRTVVPFSEYLRRLTAARFQMDVMGSEMLLMSRIDSYHAEFITSVVDYRDHKYVKGATNLEVGTLIHAVNKAIEAGEDVQEARFKWLAEAKVMTFPEAVQAAATEQEYQEFSKLMQAKQFPSLAEMKSYASKTVAAPVNFDWEISRSSVGQYLYKSCPQNVIERAIAAMPLTDTTWARMDTPIWKDIVEIHTALREVDPARCFGFGFTGAFNYAGAGYSEKDVAELPHNLAKLGIVFQTQPIFALQGTNMFVYKFAKMFKEEGMAGYLRDIQGPSLSEKHDHGGTAWGGNYLADQYLNIANAMDLSMNL